MFIARQPIFDRTMSVYGYELLYRALENSKQYEGASAELSTATVLGGLFELGLEQIVGNKRAFINFDAHFLLSDSIELIAPSSLVIEVLENTVVTDALIERITYLSKKGYKIALDDFAENFHDYPIVPLANIIKYDIMITPLSTLEKDVKAALEQKKVLLAEKIETAEEFQQAVKMGFHLFQGYFFSKPSIVGGIRSKNTNNTVYQRILAELHKEEPSYKKLTEIVETDVNMAYRVMKASKRLGGEDINKTIRNALTIMGLRELERWINVLMLQEMAQNKPFELVRLSLIRAKFGELIADHSSFHNRKHEISLMCLFTVLDAFLDQPMESALEGVAVSADVREVLIYKQGVLLPFYKIIEAYENGQWEDTTNYTKEIGIKQEKLYQLYMEAIAWANMVREYL
jgi:EAL and modified HD-GYP domain-containing signal transduction protein